MQFPFSSFFIKYTAPAMLGHPQIDNLLKQYRKSQRHSSSLPSSDIIILFTEITNNNRPVCKLPPRKRLQRSISTSRFLKPDIDLADTRRGARISARTGDLEIDNLTVLVAFVGDVFQNF